MSLRGGSAVFTHSAIPEADDGVATALREGVPEPQLYAWRDAALPSALSSLE